MDSFLLGRGLQAGKVVMLQRLSGGTETWQMTRRSFAVQAETTLLLCFMFPTLRKAMSTPRYIYKVLPHSSVDPR